MHGRALAEVISRSCTLILDSPAATLHGAGHIGERLDRADHDDMLVCTQQEGAVDAASHRQHIDPRIGDRQEARHVLVRSSFQDAFPAALNMPTIIDRVE